MAATAGRKFQPCDAEVLRRDMRDPTRFRAYFRVGALVGTVLQQPVGQVTEGAMRFNTVETGLLRQHGCLFELLNDGFDFNGLKCAGHGKIGAAAGQEEIALRRDGGWSHGQFAVADIGVRNPAAVP